MIDRAPEIVWPFVVTAESFREWNEKIVSMDASGPFRVGQTFATHYALKANATQFVTEVVRVEEGRLLELRHANPVGPGARTDMVVTERVTLHGRAGRSRTIVTRDVTVKNHGLPWILVPLIWFITRFGKPTGKDRLKEMVEAPR